MNTLPDSRFASRGLSLIELLVAVALGGILMGGAISLFINNRATYEVTNDMARLQENARFALQLMTEDLRMAGYIGCVNEYGKVNDNVSTDITSGIVEGDLASFAHPIEGINDGGASWLPSGAVGSAPFLADSDAITVRYFDGDRSLTGTDVDLEVVNESPQDANPANTQILVRNLDLLSVSGGQLYSIADCGGADVFTVDGTGSDGTTGFNYITASRLSRSYEAVNRALVAPAVAVRYFVRNNDAGVPALYRARYDADAPEVEIEEELVDGVHTLQLLYGVDANNDSLPDRFITPGTDIPHPTEPAPLRLKLVDPEDYQGVVAIKIALLMQTVDEFGDVPDDVVYDVADRRFCRVGLVAVPACDVTFPSDRRRRRVFQTTVAVRNFQ